MKTLILETSSESSGLFLVEDRRLLGQTLLTGGPELSRRLAAEAAALLQGQKVDFLFSGQGPGSFTGIRVAAAFAQGLSFGWQIPLYGFCSLKAFAPENDGPFAIVFDAKMGGVYSLFGVKSGPDIAWEKPEQLQPETLLSKINPDLSLLTPHPESLERRLPKTRWQKAPLNASYLAALAFDLDSTIPLHLAYDFPTTS